MERAAVEPAHQDDEDDDRDDCRDDQPFGHGPRRVGCFVHFGCVGGEALAAHFGAELVADFSAVEPDRRRVALGKAGGVGRRGKRIPIGRLNAFEMAARNPRLRGDVLEAEALLLARGA